MDVSAQVVLKARGPITAATLEKYRPRRRTAEAAMRLFRDAGFALGPYIGISFSVTGPPALFERFFRVGLAGMKSLEFPLAALPADVAATIEAVTFTPPPDFGPSGSGP